MNKENLKLQPNGFYPPQLGSSILMICVNCGWHGSAKFPGFVMDFERARMRFFPKPKCPNCGKKSLMKNPAVKY